MENETVDVAEKKAKKEVTKEEQLHLDARDARVAQVKAAIAAAKESRDLQEKEGTTETTGAKLDREAKEEKDLEEAAVLNVVEPFVSETNQADVKVIADKLNEVIAILNHHKWSK